MAGEKDKNGKYLLTPENIALYGGGGLDTIHLFGSAPETIDTPPVPHTYQMGKLKPTPENLQKYSGGGHQVLSLFDKD